MAGMTVSVNAQRSIHRRMEADQVLGTAPKSGTGKRGRPISLDRCLPLNAVFYVVRSGCAWRHVIGDFSLWQTVYAYFRRGARTGRGPSFTTCCGTACAKPKDTRRRPLRPSWTVKQSRRPDQSQQTRLRRSQGDLGTQTPCRGRLSAHHPDHRSVQAAP